MHRFCFGDSRLPSNKCYFRPMMSSKPPSKPRVELIFYSGLQFFWILFFEFHISLPGKASLVSTSRAVLFLRAWRVYFPLRWRSNFVENVVLEWERWGLRGHLVPPPILCIILYGGWIWANYPETRTTTSNSRVSVIDFYLVFPTNFKIVFLPHTNTVI